ncbi:ClpP class serine protease [Rhodovulum sulfidophilum]|uniref:S49 family peptidase n=1 Tax=Rhodovulum sulfidophilum TaxID=35806 RepID=UPI0005A912C2|nr:S49 family peptidase [Rhodovulum sulfidophilum]ANB35964.1 peptidase S49 [Rhodovulum sulfidophilum DSM 1374]MCW2305477.1 ClpP class serine protease [Rhodovulum sulfidophilum]
MEMTIASLLGAAPLALDHDFGAGLLGLPLPAAPAAGPALSGPVEVARGERFAVARGVAVMPVRGVLTPNAEILERYLGWATFAGIEASCGALAAQEDVAAVVIEFDTPGGLVLGGAAAAGAIAALAAVKPVHALVNPLAASMGYHLASQCSEIAMTPGSLAGSIGIMRQAGWPVGPDRAGQQWQIFTSTHARAKLPNPETEAGRAEIRRDLDAHEAAFHADVARGRGIAPGDLAARLSVTDDPTDGGATFGPEAAIARGLADRAETRLAFYDRIFAAHAPRPAARRSSGRGHLAQAAAAQARATL